MVISETPGSRRGEFLAVPFDKNENMVGSDGNTGPPCRLHRQMTAAEGEVEGRRALMLQDAHASISV